MWIDVSWKFSIFSSAWGVVNWGGGLFWIFACRPRVVLFWWVLIFFCWPHFGDSFEEISGVQIFDRAEENACVLSNLRRVNLSSVTQTQNIVIVHLTPSRMLDRGFMN